MKMKLKIRMRSSGYTTEVECNAYTYSGDTVKTIKTNSEGEDEIVNGLFYGVETVEILSFEP